MVGQRHLLDGVGLWADVRAPAGSGGALLLLDRDGVVNEDHGYVGDPDAIVLVPGIADAIARCARAGIPAAIVTNQSGIARGYFGWDDFDAVQRRIDDLLAKEGAAVAAVFACAYHADGAPGLDLANHPWRKPGPGMLDAAIATFAAQPAASAMIGDKLSDMVAAASAGIFRRFLLGGGAVPSGATPVVSIAEAAAILLDAADRPSSR